VNITKEESRTLHALYAAVHRAHKDLPAVWTDHECNRILTAIMAAKPFSWRVVGITPKALRQFSELDFRYKGQLGFTRAHIVPRITTVRSILETEEPLPEDVFLDIWLKNDRTVICSRGENKAALPEYISFENDDGALFSCAGKLAGWGHKKREREFLRDLFQKMPAQ
jgi:hypothetical protein